MSNIPRIAHLVELHEMLTVPHTALLGAQVGLEISFLSNHGGAAIEEHHILTAFK